MSLINAGVGKVIYRYEYRIRDGVDLLRKAGVVVDDYMREVVE